MNKNLYQPEFTDNDQVSKEDETIQLLLMRADYFAQVGDHEQSLKCYQNILDTKPDCLDAKMGVGIVHLQGNNRPLARKMFEEALLIHPSSKRAAIGLALVKLDDRDFAGAFEMLRMAEVGYD